MLTFLLHPILHAAHLIEELLRKELAAVGLQPRQARIIVTLAKAGPVSQADLARAFNVSRASMTVMVSRLLRDGLLAEETAPGRKRPVLALTSAGSARVPGIEQAWQRVDARLETALGREAARAFSHAALAARDALGGRAPHDIVTPERASQ